MKKLLLMIVALSFIAVIPKAASAFSLYELTDPSIAHIAWGVNGAEIKLDVSQAQIPQFGETLTAQLSDDAANALSAALSMKSQRYSHFMLADTNGDGILEVGGFSIGSRAIPAYM